MTTSLVAYFSASGTTARVAETLASAASADLFEIAPANPYPAADLDWTDRSSRSTKEMNDEASRPAMKVDAPSLDGYDTIFVGFPIWWYVEPRIIDTFLESTDFAGKTIVPFATSGGSGLGKAPERMASLTPGATVLPGKLLNGGPSDTTLRTWIENLQIVPPPARAFCHAAPHAWHAPQTKVG